MPAFTRSLRISRSNSAKTASIPGERAACGRRHVEGFGKGDEADPQFGEFFQGDDEVGKRSSPPVEPPNEDCVHLAAADGGEQFLALRPLQSAGADFLDLGNDLPATSVGVLPHGSDLKWKRLLVVS
jgi:hypothetical protein